MKSKRVAASEEEITLFLSSLRSALDSLFQRSFSYLLSRRKETDLCTGQSIVRAWPRKTNGKKFLILFACFSRTINKKNKKQNQRIRTFSSFLFIFGIVFLFRSNGHAFLKTVYNIFSYACAVVRANARSPLGFFELLLSLFLNKLVFLFVRTAVDLVANPVEEATGE